MLGQNEPTKQMKTIPLSECIAKTISKNNQLEKGVTVEQHSLIVAYVARELLKMYPQWIRKNLFPKGSDYIASIHDIGKISPSFQDKIYMSCHERLDLIANSKKFDESIGYHSSVSQASLKEINETVSDIIGRHHGYNPKNFYNSTDECMGGEEWQRIREELLKNLKVELSSDFPTDINAIQSETISGLTTVSDWLGSTEIFDSFENAKKKAKQIVSSVGFVNPKIKSGLSFEEIFGFKPNDTQITFSDVISKQGVYVLEAPMGVGKTEASLYVAYKMIEAGMARGIYFALPTQLTSEKIYERMNSFLEKIVADNHKSLLLHSNAWLKVIDCGGDSWFNYSKRGLLAPYGVGTIDQALLSVVNAQHNFVRSFGLAGKVVILDEVHSYDMFTYTLIKDLIKNLKELQCTVIILSATLTKKQKEELVGIEDTKTESYPQISALPKKRAFKKYSIPFSQQSEVEIELSNDESKAINIALEKIENGEQLLWIENTIIESQRIYSIFKNRDVECGLLHSRYIRNDRQTIEDKWVKLFGKNNPERTACGRILIGTQVLEQSLDIDADYLITRICPSDMLIQRMGRLWRHSNIRPKGSERKVFILSPKFSEAVNDTELFGLSKKVYHPYILCRTLEIFENLKKISIPNDIRDILEKTYSKRNETGELDKLYKSLKTKEGKFRMNALFELSTDGITKSDEAFFTRYSETPTNEVLLLKSIKENSEGVFFECLDGENIIIKQDLQWYEKREIALKVMKHSVRVPFYLAPASHKRVELLKGIVYLGNDSTNYNFRIGYVRQDNTIVGENEQHLEYRCFYDSTQGYKFIKEGDTQWISLI